MKNREDSLAILNAFLESGEKTDSMTFKILGIILEKIKKELTDAWDEIDRLNKEINKGQ